MAALPRAAAVGVRELEVNDLSNIVQRISEEPRGESMPGYASNDRKRDGNWRKLKVRLLPPPGLPPLDVPSREGYYAPSQ